MAVLGTVLGVPPAPAGEFWASGWVRFEAADSVSEQYANGTFRAAWPYEGILNVSGTAFVTKALQPLTVPMLESDAAEAPTLRLTGLLTSDKGTSRALFGIGRIKSQTAVAPYQWNINSYMVSSGQLEVFWQDFKQALADAQAVVAGAVTNLSETTDADGYVVIKVDIPSVKPTAPSDLTATRNGNTVTLNWADNSLDETGFMVQASSDGVSYDDLYLVGPGVTTKAIAQDVFTGKYYQVAAVKGSSRSNYTPAVLAAAAYPAGAQGIYDFMAGAGSTVFDLSGQGRDATLVSYGGGAPVWSGGVLEFLNQGYIDFPAAVGNPDPVNGLHIVGLFYSPQYQAGDSNTAYLWGQWAGGSDPKSNYVLSLAQGNSANTSRPTLSSRNGSGGITNVQPGIVSPFTIQDNGWHWVEIILTANLRTVRVDGVDVTSATTPGIPVQANPTAAMRIGNIQALSTANKLRGKFAHFSVYPRALTTSERAMLINYTKNRLAALGITVGGP